jgi:hypothetical protein
MSEKIKYPETGASRNGQAENEGNLMNLTGRQPDHSTGRVAGNAPGSHCHKNFILAGLCRGKMGVPSNGPGASA